MLPVYCKKPVDAPYVCLGFGGQEDAFQASKGQLRLGVLASHPQSRLEVCLLCQNDPETCFCSPAVDLTRNLLMYLMYVGVLIARAWRTTLQGQDAALATASDIL